MLMRSYSKCVFSALTWSSSRSTTSSHTVRSQWGHSEVIRGQTNSSVNRASAKPDCVWSHLIKIANHHTLTRESFLHFKWLKHFSQSKWRSRLLQSVLGRNNILSHLDVIDGEQTQRTKSFIKSISQSWKLLRQRILKRILWRTFSLNHNKPTTKEIHLAGDTQ